MTETVRGWSPCAVKGLWDWPPCLAGEEMALGDLTGAFQPLGEELKNMEPGYHTNM